MCGIEKVAGLQCKLTFRLLSHYICILSLPMHFVKHLSTPITNFNNTISKGGGKGGGGGEQKVSKGGVPAPHNETLPIHITPHYLQLPYQSLHSSVFEKTLHQNIKNLYLTDC